MEKRVRSAAVSGSRENNHSSIYACYTGCMLGFSLAVLPFRAYAKEYAKHRERMLRCFAELGAKVALPPGHKDFVREHEPILQNVQNELGRVAHTCLGWTLFGTTAIEFAMKHAIRSREALPLKRAAALYLGKMQLPKDVLTKLGRASRLDKDGNLSLYTLHSAALAMLNEIIGHMKREPRTAFVAMPFSVPRMSGYYASLYRPLVDALECRPLRAWGGFGTEDYQDLLYTLLDRCGYMVGDISTWNPNVMHEVGYAIGKGDKFIVLIAEEHQSLPPNLGDLAVLRYKTAGRNWQSLAVRELAATVALFRYATEIDSPGKRSRRIVGPMKVTS